MADHEVTEHEHGTMDVSDHQKTFAAFIRFSTWVCILAAVALVFMALTNA
ncbi:aa3-type cytochrome c oxidase subunit IV [Paracoccus albus]|nr:aa3-type cytochrome c oxidase subunit IV [Paracoccus albus]WBU60248.1 aa3-type cytochrome c oxidase subunit IV [Paracoccus albus]